MPAVANPSDFSTSTRSSAFLSRSSRVPKLRQFVGHALMHAGSSPTSTRSTHSEHFETFPVVGIQFRNIERTAGDAVAASNAVVRIEIHDPVRMLHDRAGRRACFQASRIHAMHALILRHQPQRLSGIGFVLVELDQVPEVWLKIRKRLIGSFEVGKRYRLVVPFLARDFTRLAADARGRVDQLRDSVRRARRRPEPCRASRKSL